MRILSGQLILYVIPLPSHTLDVSLSLLSFHYLNPYIPAYRCSYSIIVLVGGHHVRANKTPEG